MISDIVYFCEIILESLRTDYEKPCMIKADDVRFLVSDKVYLWLGTILLGAVRISVLILMQDFPKSSP